MDKCVSYQSVILRFIWEMLYFYALFKIGTFEYNVIFCIQKIDACFRWVWLRDERKRAFGAAFAPPPSCAPPRPAPTVLSAVSVIEGRSGGETIRNCFTSHRLHWAFSLFFSPTLLFKLPFKISRLFRGFVSVMSELWDAVRCGKERRL